MPWPGEMAVFRSAATDGFALLTTFGTRARMGVLAADFYAGPMSRFDLGNALVVDLFSGTLESVIRAMRDLMFEAFQRSRAD